METGYLSDEIVLYRKSHCTFTDPCSWYLFKENCSLQLNILNIAWFYDQPLRYIYWLETDEICTTFHSEQEMDMYIKNIGKQMR